MDNIYVNNRHIWIIFFNNPKTMYQLHIAHALAGCSGFKIPLVEYIVCMIQCYSDQWMDPTHTHTNTQTPEIERKDTNPLVTFCTLIMHTRTVWVLWFATISKIEIIIPVLC